VQAGLLRAVKRGVFEITDAGRELLARQPSKIDFHLLMSYPTSQSFTGGRSKSEDKSNLRRQKSRAPT
jgi:restriction endonuclease Mrr